MSRDIGMEIEKQVPGFENVDEFLGYCESETKDPFPELRADYADLLYELAGEHPRELTGKMSVGFIEFERGEMKRLLLKIRERNSGVLYV